MADYRISRRIGRGGMAEVFLALQEGIGGFEKLVVIKRIFKHFCEDEAFVRMFLDEARLAASIRHPNVVEILDIKKDDAGFYIVMEYLSGENLAYVFEELSDRGKLMPAHLVCRVGAEIAAGLHSAHISTDVHGKLEPIIHRDVTPSNLIVCWSGVVKIVDFGVAKAQAADRQTRPGMLKGKLEYLAPEQVRNEPVMPSTDVFQLGVVLHELFTGQRLFGGDSDHEIMNAVLEREIAPPSSLRGDLPTQVDDVVMAALERDPNKRTASADKLRRGLEGVMRYLGTGAHQRSLGEWVSAAFAERKAERVKVERECVQSVREGRASSEVPAMLAPFAPTAPVVYDAERATAATVAERPSGRGITAPRRRGHGRWWFPVAAFALLGGGYYLWQRSDASSPVEGASSPVSTAAVAAADEPPALAAAPTATVAPPLDAAPPQPQAYQVAIETRPATAEILLDGEPAGRGQLAVSLLRDGQSHRIEVRAPGHAPQTIVFRDAPPPPVVELAPLDTPRTAARPQPVPPKPDTPAAPVVESEPRGDAKARTTGDGPRLPPTDNRNPWKKKR